MKGRSDRAQELGSIALPNAARAVASYLLGRAVLQQCVAVLAPLDIPVLLLKGLWLQHFVYADAPQRSITDVDVLVPRQCYARAQQALVRAGWQVRLQELSESSYLPPGLPLPIDLHAALYTRGAFHVALPGIFARAQPDTELFGCPVLLPDPLDVLSHLVGHALKSGTAWSARGQELSDIARLAQRFAISPPLCAARLQADGLARAARFVLPLLAANEPAGFASQTLRYLAPDPSGELLVRLASALRRVTRADARAHTVVGFMLDSSVGRGGYALWLRVLERWSACAADSGKTACRR